MGYPLRPDIRGATYHLGSRGTNKETIFFDDFDRDVFLRLLAKVTSRQSWVVLAYCLMTTHYHLVVHVPEGGLSAGMRLLNMGYSTRTNRRYERTMHLFRQRFFSVQIEGEEHLLNACRYGDINPVRAGICSLPEEWTWSSYRSCAGLDVAPSFLSTQALLKHFGRDLREAESAYRAFVRAGHGPGSDPEPEVWPYWD